MDDGAILVTGATGFVGRRIVERLRAAGRSLVLATRRPVEAPPGCRVVGVGEIGPATDWRDALEGVSAVVHLAAHVHVAPEQALAEAELFDRVNHLGAVRLFDDAAAAGVGLFLFLSSITVLGGSSPPGHPFDDATGPRPETPYGRSKLAAEEALRGRSEGGMQLVILRPPLIAGPGVGGNLRSLARLAALPVPLPFGAVRNRRTLLSLDNLGSAVEAVLARPSPGIFVIGDRAPLSTGQIVAALRAGLGRRPGLVPVPPGIIGAVARLAGFGGHAQRLLGDLEVDPTRFRERYGWRDEVETEAVLRETAAAFAATVPPHRL